MRPIGQAGTALKVSYSNEPLTTSANESRSACQGTSAMKLAIFESIFSRTGAPRRDDSRTWSTPGGSAPGRHWLKAGQGARGPAKQRREARIGDFTSSRSVEVAPPMVGADEALHHTP
jgi:hypothetical protein